VGCRSSDVLPPLRASAAARACPRRAGPVGSRGASTTAPHRHVGHTAECLLCAFDASSPPAAAAEWVWTWLGAPDGVATICHFRRAPDRLQPIDEALVARRVTVSLLECSPFRLLTVGDVRCSGRPHGGTPAEGSRPTRLQHGVQAGNGSANPDWREDAGRAKAASSISRPASFGTGSGSPRRARRRRSRPVRTSSRPANCVTRTRRSASSSAHSAGRRWRSRSCARPRRS
jgi:hypothetical protein